MKKYNFKFILIGVMAQLSIWTNPVNAQISHDMLMNLSAPLANQMGKVYQMQKNCNFTPDLTPRKVGGLFINYMTQKQTRMIMVEHSKGVKKMKSWKCDKKQVIQTTQALLESMANYIKMAQPFMKPFK
jgi:hypothetical protein